MMLSAPARGRRILASLLVVACGLGATTAAGPGKKKRQRQAAEAAARADTWIDVAIDPAARRVHFLRPGDVVSFDITDPAHPREVAQTILRGQPATLRVDGPEAYLAASTGLQRFDWIDREEAEQDRDLEIGWAPGQVWSTFGSPQHVVRSPSRIWIADGRGGIHQLETRTDGSVRLRQAATARGRVERLAIDGDRLATAEGEAGALVYRIDERGRLERQDWLRESTGARDVRWLNGRLWVARGSKGLDVYEWIEATPRPVDTERPDRDRSLLGGDPVLAVVPHAGAMALLRGRCVEWVDPESPSTVLAQATLPRGCISHAGAADGARLWIACDRAGFAMVERRSGSEGRLVLPPEKRMRINLDGGSP